jgi:uncharacterized protein (TIGR00251 family)
VSDLAGLALQEVEGEVRFPVKAIPASSRSTVQGLLGPALKIRVAAAPERGRANAAICRLLAEVLGVADRDVRISHGHANPNKQVAVRGMTSQEVLEKLEAHIAR